MSLDILPPSTEPSRRLSIAPCHGGWAVKHGDGFLGTAGDREEALRLMQALQAEFEPAPAAAR